MSTSTNGPRASIGNKRLSKLQDERLQRNSSYSRRRVVTPQDAYTNALKAAYLAYLLQPRAKKHVPAPRQPQRSSTSVTDLVKDFSLIRDSKSTKFPHGFMAALDKRIEGVLIGRERMPEYGDSLVKRTFAVFLNEFKAPQFRKSMEKDRRVEDLLLIFFSNATKELKKGKPPDDDSWKLMVDRHVALFIRLLTSILRDHDWARERPELSSRLQTMEKKLLVHDQDLASNGGGPAMVEVEVARSYEIKDMPLVQVLCSIFNISWYQAQQDIAANKSVWTEEAALQDLKKYQMYLSLNTKKTLNSDDFDTEEAYEMWKKSEIPDLSQMMLAIIQSNPALAKSTGASLPQFKPSGISQDPGYADVSRTMSTQSDNTSSYVIDQPVDMSNLSLRHSQYDIDENDDSTYTFIPPDPRSYYRAVLKQALTYDLSNTNLQPTEATSEAPSMKLLSKESAELLNELALRWRVPQFSRLVLFLDVIREKYQHNEIILDTLDAAFIYVKEPPVEDKKSRRMSQMVQTSLFDRTKWTVTDFALNGSILSSLHDALLRELFELLLQCYEKKAPSLGPIMYVLTNHIYDDELFSKTDEELDGYTRQLQDALREKARDVYAMILSKEIPSSSAEWEFFHVIQLGKAVVSLCERIQKRYRRNPEIMGVNPLVVLLEEMLPSYASDSRDIVSRILEMVKAKGDEVDIQDGFDLYKELVEIRRVHAEALPGREFAFHIEGLLQEFVWRWIQITDEKLVPWVEGAVKHDDFTVRTSHPENIPTDDERHSVSVIDIFRSFNQSIEQIVNLNWDDDLQYAKFMTALSKSVGNGVARYCELIEQGFAREMDRLTPEQEAAASQTRQEKWMQFAKDAWANKEKVEPFHFLPEVSLLALSEDESS